MDITDLILRQHDEQRHAFALLDDIDRDDRDALAAVWQRLEVLLEVHADAEERFFYPELLRVGAGVGGADGPDDEVQDAIKDHNEIRDGIRKVREQEPGSDGWWAAVRQCREDNSDHMAEEEREDLPDFRRHADLELRHAVAVRFVTYESEHADGVPPRDKDPQRYVETAG